MHRSVHIYGRLSELDAHHIHVFRFLGLSSFGCAQLAVAGGVFRVVARVSVRIVFRRGETKFGDLAKAVGGESGVKK